MTAEVSLAAIMPGPLDSAAGLRQALVGAL
jgi:hypothetical protein